MSLTTSHEISNGQQPYPDISQKTATDSPRQAATSAPTDDLFADLANLRLSQAFDVMVGVKKARLTVPVRKPAKEWFIRTNAKLRVETCVLELKEDRETFLVTPSLWAELASESTFGPRALFAAMNRQDVLFIWPSLLALAIASTLNRAPTPRAAQIQIGFMIGSLLQRPGPARQVSG